MANNDTETKYLRSRRWRILLASIFVLMLDYGFLYALGSMFVPMLDIYGENRGKTATVQSIYNGVSFMSSTFTGLVVSKWGPSSGMMISSVLIPLGFFASFFAKSLIHLYFSIGIVAGVGNSFVFVSCVVSVGQVFPKNQRPLALSLQMTFMGLASIIYPYFLNWLLDIYSLSGTFLLLSGLYFNTFITAIIYRYEVKPHSEPEEKQPNECLDDEKDSQVMTRVSSKFKHTRDEESGEKYNRKTSTHMVESRAICDTAHNCGIKTNNYEVTDISNMSKSLIRLQECGTEAGKPENGVVRKTAYNIEPRTDAHRSDKGFDTKTDKSISENAIGELNHGGLCSIPYLLFAVASSLLIGNITGFITIAQDIFVTKGLSVPESLTGFLVFNIANTVSRLAPGIVAKLNLSCYVTSVVASLLGLAGQLTILFSDSFIPLMFGSGLSGAALGGYASSVVTATFELLGPSRQAVGFGLIVTINGVSVTCVGPTFGTIRDASGDYNSVLVTTVCLNAACFVLICAVILITHCRRKLSTR